MSLKRKNMLVINGASLKDAVSTISDVAKNATTEENRVVNFVIHQNKMALVSSDSARIIQVTLDINSDLEERFSTSVEKLSVVLDGNESNTLVIEKDNLMYLKTNAEVQLPKFETRNIPFVQNEYSDKIPLQDFVKKFKSLSKHLTKEYDDTGVIFISGGYMYIRNRLFYGLTECLTDHTYTLDKFVCKNIIKMCSVGLSKGVDFIEFTQAGGSCFVRVGNVEMNFPSTRHGLIDIKSLDSLNNFSGFITAREPLSKAIKEINLTTGVGEVDINGVDSQIILKPSSDLFATSYTVVAKPVITEGFQLNFLHTVNSDAILNILKAIETSFVFVSTSKGNTLIIVEKEETYTVRYYALVM